jgi:hypothetical protein
MGLGYASNAKIASNPNPQSGECISDRLLKVQYQNPILPA